MIYGWFVAGSLILTGAAGVGGYYKGKTDSENKHRIESASIVIDVQRENLREISRLVKANEKIQQEYNDANEAANIIATELASNNRMHDKQRSNIIAAATRSSDSCGRYASAAEIDIATAEEGRRSFGIEAARASSTSYALRNTLEQRKQAIDAKRKDIK